MNYMKFNDGGNIEAMMAAMSGQQGGQRGQEDLRTIDGQSTSEVQEDEEGRQFVMFKTPTGDTVKVFGDWESYGEIAAPGGGAVAPGDQRFIADREFPVMANPETGEYELDVDAMETEMYSEPERQMAQQAAPGGPGASGVEALLESLTDAKGPQGQRRQGGMVPYGNGGRLSRDERRKARSERRFGRQIKSDLSDLGWNKKGVRSLPPPSLREQNMIEFGNEGRPSRDLIEFGNEGRPSREERRLGRQMKRAYAKSGGSTNAVLNLLGRYGK